MICLYFAYPLGWALHYLVRGTYTRHMFSIFFGILVQYYMYKNQIKHTFCMITITYFALILFPRQQ